MKDYTMINIVKRIGIILMLILFLAMGFGLGSMGKVKQSEVTEARKTAQQEKNKTNKKLTQKEVKEFLIAYYTRKDLEENRARYKSYMTEGMYNAEVSEEDKAVNQAYKGFVVDQVFDSANIYIDEINNKVIVEAKYSNTVLQEKNSTKNALKDQSNTATIRLAYTKIENKFLVNNIEAIVLTDSTSSNYEETEEENSTMTSSDSINTSSTETEQSSTDE